ncbi:hypothetical protein MOB93_17535 [Bacillus inaquosorum]|uniref:hypothetical protein n=1 Tax=Bacillus inaquosorum TaxID=483913 RepID=UPI00227EE068|nr:hypothetical protein [Bacillus inaquosorum]MCY7943830.1 hypothetical protein [Bacillus inaquosorum]
MGEEIKQLRCTVAELLGENEQLKAENEKWLNELAEIRDMLPQDYHFEPGTPEYAIANPEGVKDLVRQIINWVGSK